MKKIIRRILMVVISGVMGAISIIPTFAEEYTQGDVLSLKVYADELTKINEELETNYRIPVEYFDEFELEEITQMFTKMSVEEFRDYIYTAHYNYISENSDDNNTNSELIFYESKSISATNSFSECKLVPTEVIFENDEIIPTLESAKSAISNPNSSYTLVTQRYYYDVGSTSNYLYLQAENFTMNGYPRYNTYDSFAGGYLISNYPGYKATACSISFSNYDRAATCTFTYLRMIAKGVDDESGSHTISCTFIAGGGDIYAV